MKVVEIAIWPRSNKEDIWFVKEKKSYKILVMTIAYYSIVIYFMERKMALQYLLVHF
jgi:hypothetical protein